MPVACASSNYNIIYLMKKVTLIIIGPKGAVNKSFHWAAYLDDIPTVWWYYPWSGKVSCHPFRRQCFDYYHDITVIHLLRDQSTATTLRRSSVIHYGIKTRRAATTWMNCIDIYWCREQQLQGDYLNRITSAPPSLLENCSFVREG